MLSDDEQRALVAESQALREALTKAYQEAAPVDLDALDAAVQKMTPGPWKECRASESNCACGLLWSLPADLIVASVKPSGCDGAEARNGADAIGLAALVNAWPGLLTELRAARKAKLSHAEAYRLVEEHEMALGDADDSKWRKTRARLLQALEGFSKD